MNCKEFKDKVVDLFDTTIDMQPQAECKAHMAECPECKAYYEELAEAFNALQPQEATDRQSVSEPVTKHRHLWHPIVAAIFIGILFISGIAFAAIQIVRNINTPKPQLPTTEQATDIETVTSLPADTVKADTIPTEPYVFNNVPLDSMLAAIAAAHGVGVEFENDAVRQFRFHFVWKREDSLTRVVEKLNTFEAVNIGMEDKKLVVR